ncbi:MAG: hypothetical protein GXY82_08035 [Methanospirillum sp.]|nr:hypothetical protein [Methanospirillum sp.]
MKDPRLRLLAVAALSVAAFHSVPGALFALLWWLVFGRRTAVPPAVALFLGVTTVLAALAASASGGDGPSYLVRCGAVFVIAAHAHAAQRDGDLLDLGAWLGNRAGCPRAGFDLGLVGELALGSIAAAADDLERIRFAAEQKGSGPVSRWVAVGTALLFAELRRSRDLARNLAVRGYHGGGRHDPVFSSPIADLPAAVAAISVLIAAILAPHEFFILSL